MREKKDINIEIGGNIQVAREQAGYTQDTLSEMLGMTPNHLSAIERGASGISLEPCSVFAVYSASVRTELSLGLMRQKRKPCACQTYFGYKAGIPATGSRAAVRYFEYVIKKEPLPTPKTGIDRGSWFVFRAFKQVPKSTLISALKKKLRREYNHLGWSICAALRLAITGFFDP